VMVPPYDWGKVLLYNEDGSAALGVYFDTDKHPEPVPCEKYYYFYQDTTILSGTREINDECSRSMNYPNPFSSSTKITFDNPDHQSFDLYLYDLNSRLVRHDAEICDDHVIIHGEDLEPGTYYYKLAGSHVYTGKIIAL
jgi:hypothetical protein